VRNLFTLRVVNKTRADLDIRLKLDAKEGTLSVVGDKKIVAHANGLAESAFFIDLPLSELDGIKTPISISLYSGDRLLERVETTFIGPATE
jgi:hypothetical protein